jgi:peptidylprolyl isomerase
VLHVEKAKFPPNIDPKEGMVLNLKGPEEQAIPAVIVEVRDESVTIDANHPLSGKDLTFSIELAEIL